MSTLVRVEIGKLRTLRSTWVTNLVGVVLALALAKLVLNVSSDEPEAVGDMISNAGLIGLFVTIVVAIQMANEYQHRTIATAFTLVPSRTRVIAAKALAAVVVAAALSVAYMLLGLLVTLLSYGEVHWTLGEILRFGLGGIVVASTMAVGGVAFGALTRSAGGAVSATIGAYVVLETILTSFVRQYTEYGISAMQLAAMTPFPDDPAYAYGVAVLLNVAVALVLFSVAVATVRRVDV